MHAGYAKAQSNPRCQCKPSCRRPPEGNSPFCKKHRKKCTRKALISQSTTPYQPWRYNKHPGVQSSLNCYAYAMDYLKLPKKCTLDKCDESYPQPGLSSGYPHWSEVKGKRCPDVIARIKGDIPGAKRTTFRKKCPDNKRKIAVVVDPDEDYHFYRQDKDGYWSHKPGGTKVQRRDTTKRRIYDPQLAARDNKISRLNYDTFCGYMCVPADRRAITLKR